MRLSTRIIFEIILFLGLLIMTLRPIEDPDFWWHLRTGQLIYETGEPPHMDPFSFTLPGKVWIAHEWLTELFLYFLYRFGGFGLLIIAFSIIITASYLVVYLSIPSKSYGAGFAVLLASLASAPAWGVRPQMITLVLTAIFLYLLDAFREKGRWQYLMPLPFLTVLWVNLHAGYFLGFAIIGVHLAGTIIEVLISLSKREKAMCKSIIRLGLVLIACAFFSLINPNTYHILTYPLETLTSPSMMTFIEEWFSPDFHQTEWIPLAILLLAMIALPAIIRRPVPITRILLVCLLGFMALRSMRNVPLFALTAIPFLGEQFSGFHGLSADKTRITECKKWLNFVLILLVLMAVTIRAVVVIRDQPSSEQKNFPTDATAWIINNHPEGNIYNTYGWGGYLIWRLYPEYKVYIDGRADVYGDEYIYDYLRIYSGRTGWDTALQDAGVNIILIETGSGLADALFQSPDWSLCSRDETSVLFIRK